MRMIDADDFRREIDKHWPFTKEEQCKHGIADMAKSELLYVLNQMPIIEERKKGKWQWLSSTYDRTPCEMRYMCSECHHETILHSNETSYPWEKFCPNCGSYNGGET